MSRLGLACSPHLRRRRSSTRVNQGLHTVEQELKPEHEALIRLAGGWVSIENARLEEFGQGWEGILVDQPLQGGAVRQLEAGAAWARPMYSAACPRM